MKLEGQIGLFSWGMSKIFSNFEPLEAKILLIGKPLSAEFGGAARFQQANFWSSCYLIKAAILEANGYGNLDRDS